MLTTLKRRYLCHATWNSSNLNSSPPAIYESSVEDFGEIDDYVYELLDGKHNPMYINPSDLSCFFFRLDLTRLWRISNNMKL